MLAQAQRMRGSRLHLLCLDTPLSRCVRNVVARRRAGQAARPAIERTARAGHAALLAACEALRRSDAEVETLDAAAALCRTVTLLGLNMARAEDGFANPIRRRPGQSVRGFAINCKM